MRSLLLPAILLLAIGCGAKADNRVVGDWVGKFVSSDGATRSGANLRLDDRHHWRELYGNMDVEGSWSLSGDTVTLKTELFDHRLVADAKKMLLAKASQVKDPKAYEAMARNLDQPMELTVSPDGKSLSHEDAAAGGKVVYTRD